MKEQMPATRKSEKSTNSTFEEIKKDLEIPQRTQAPPSEELIASLNQKASQPPFSYIHKQKNNNLR